MLASWYWEHPHDVSQRRKKVLQDRGIDSLKRADTEYPLLTSREQQLVKPTVKGREKLASNFSRCSRCRPALNRAPSSRPSIPSIRMLLLATASSAVVSSRPCCRDAATPRPASSVKVDFAEPPSANVGELRDGRFQLQFTGFDATVGIEVMCDHVDFARSGTRACFSRDELEQETLAHFCWSD